LIYTDDLVLLESEIYRVTIGWGCGYNGGEKELIQNFDGEFPGKWTTYKTEAGM
jgi:hypothetical protein